ncbi:uncharacterized protein N7469_001852 [Penicillium citrinum]|uniref:Uncharacterized protein n=1 Tax=Penicillium citrinum TaxID=5077 RepID=A0A9W9PFI4_PENCI|nr:uncharacterized protein N7469_001852 [Penicillium citrinum]KAJ5243525.1 hypothetical protein N7469_001852 [Penicillium citrinum]
MVKDQNTVIKRSLLEKCNGTNIRPREKSEFPELVNMTPADLRSRLKESESKSAGPGQSSGRKIVNMVEHNPTGHPAQ